MRLVLWAFSASMAYAQAVLPVVWSPRLELSGLDVLEARLERPFGAPVAVRQDHQTATISNCVGYLKETRRGFQAANDRDQRRLQFLGMDCRVLDLLRSAQPSQRSGLGDTPLDVRFLPPTVSFLPSRESLGQAKAKQAKGFSWKASEPDLLVSSSGANQVLVETATGNVRIEWCARGDFNGDGTEDLLVKVTSYAKQGTYAVIRLFLLTRNTPSEVLRVLREFD